AGGAYGPIERGMLRMSPTPDAPEDTVELSEHWVLTNADSDHFTGDVTLAFDLVYSSDTVPADPVHRVTPRDLRDLVQQDISFYAPGEPVRSQLATTVVGPDVRGLNVATPTYVASPLAQTRYTTGGDLQWREAGYRAW